MSSVCICNGYYWPKLVFGLTIVRIRSGYNWSELVLGLTCSGCAQAHSEFTTWTVPHWEGWQWHCPDVVNWQSRMQQVSCFYRRRSGYMDLTWTCAWWSRMMQCAGAARRQDRRRWGGRESDQWDRTGAAHTPHLHNDRSLCVDTRYRT